MIYECEAHKSGHRFIRNQCIQSISPCLEVTLRHRNIFKEDWLLEIATTAASLSSLPEIVNGVQARASVQTGGAVTFIDVDLTVIT